MPAKSGCELLSIKSAALPTKANPVIGRGIHIREDATDRTMVGQAKTGIAAPPCSRQQLDDWLDHYNNAVVGKRKGMRFSAILPEVDSSFPEAANAFWSTWIPFLECAVAECCKAPFGEGALKVRYLNRSEGGFEFFSEGPDHAHTWVEQGVVVDPATGQPGAAQIRTSLEERYGDAAVITFYAYEDCPVICFMTLFMLMQRLRVRCFDERGMPDGHDPIWFAYNLWANPVDKFVNATLAAEKAAEPKHEKARKTGA